MVGKFVMILGITLVIWFFAALVDVAGGSQDTVDAVLILAFLSSLALWLVTGFYLLAQNPQEGRKEKAKREDGRLAAMLLDLLSDDQRQALRQQLMDELGSDGEAVSLETLLATQNKRRS